MSKQTLLSAGSRQTMSSLEIADITGRMHKDVLRAIRNMEESWKNVTGRNFALSEYVDSTGRKLPCYVLSQTECIFVATKFNDEARARLVLRWEELERWHKQYVEERLMSLTKTNAVLTEALNEERQLADYCRESLESLSSFPVRQIAHTLQMTAQELNRFLCLHKIQYGRSGRYTPYAKYARRGFTKSRTYNHRNSDGTISTEHRTTWTEQGIKFIIELVNEMRAKEPKVMCVQLTFNF